MRRSVWLALCLVCVFTLQVQASGKKKNLDNARSLFREGAAFFKKNEYSKAAESFRAAYKMKPNWKILYNIAQSEAAAKRHGLALSAFERYLSLGGDDVVDARQNEVEKEIERLKKMVGYVTVEAPEGATIIVDNVAFGVAPIAGGIPVAGSVVHIVDVLLSNGEKLPFKKVSLVSGNTVSISFIEKEEPSHITPVSSQPNTSPEQMIVEPKQEDDSFQLSTLALAGWITAGTGAAMLIASSVTGALAIKENNKIEKNCSDGCYEPYHNSVEKRDMLAITTDTLLVVGGVAAAAGAGLLIFDYVRNKKEREKDQTVLFQPVINRQVAGASLEVRF